jgi:murein DD-endopeptidase MepM/ murein hydrolase activator NlpD
VGVFVAGAALAAVLCASSPSALLADTTALLTDATSTGAAQSEPQCPTTGTTDTTATDQCPASTDPVATDPTTTTTTTTTTPISTTPPQPTSTVTEPVPSTTAAPVAPTPPSTATQDSAPTTTTQGSATAPTTTTQGNATAPARAKSRSSVKATSPRDHQRRLRAHPRAAKKKTAKAKQASAASTPKVDIPFGLTVQLSAPPKYLIRLYRKAGRRYDIPWKILAAINGIETDYGSNLNVSSAGATGWMQFLPSTWQVYGEGGNPYDPRDSIYAAARLLQSAGASTDLPAAIYAYNHADWYVAAVLWQAANMDSRGRTKDSAHGYSLPLDARYLVPFGRTDDGVDIENAPDGAAVYSITPGIVTAIASDPAGFGPNYPVVLVTEGPLAGRYIYYGHVAASIVQQGQTVTAGEPIAVMGHTGDAASLDHGHIEIGFSDGSGTPLEQHGEEAWTASGQAMRGVLSSLAKHAGIVVK